MKLKSSYGKKRIDRCVDNRVPKQASTRGPTFGSVSVTQPIEAHIGVFDYALGYVLVQNGQPVTSMVQRPSTTERSYTVSEEGTFAMVHSLKDGRQYSHRSTFVRETNNNVTNHFSTQPNLTSSQARGQRDMLELDFGSEHRKGASNRAADALSQRKNHVIPYMLAHTQACQVDGLMRDSSKESMQKNSVAQNGMSLAKASKIVQKNGVQLLKVTQSCVTTVMNSSTDRSPTESIGGGQLVLSRLVDPPYVRKNPQTRTITKKWKWKSDIVRTFLEEVTKRSKRWVDKKCRPLDFCVGDQVLLKLRPEQTRL